MSFSFNPHWGSSNSGLYTYPNKFCVCFNPHWGSSNGLSNRRELLHYGVSIPIGVLRILGILISFSFFPVSIPIGVLRITLSLLEPSVRCKVSIPIGVLRITTYKISDLIQKSFNPHWGSSNLGRTYICPHDVVSIPIGVLRITSVSIGIFKTAGFNPHWGSSNPRF